MKKENSAGRVIKFRAWAIAGNPMVSAGNREMRYFDLEEVSFGELNDNTHVIDSSVPLMQFTGLKDKNGKEIYEADILTNEHDVKWIVQWDEDEARFRNALFLKQREIIGNIYEHGDLLK